MSTSGAEVAPRFELDHLVVAASSLAAGREWCEATFGVSPQTGGKHPSMATHNLLLSLASPRFPRAYLEIIAIDPEAPPPARRRWYDLDEPALQARLTAGPALVHWVARTGDLGAGAVVLREAGFDPGDLVDAERMTPRGLLRWRIAIVAGGRRHARGAVPLLIEWGDVHPSDDLPESGVALRSLDIGGVDPALATRLGVTALAGASARPGTVASPIVAELSGPRGRVVLTAP